jgi:hypothetical protein
MSSNSSSPHSASTGLTIGQALLLGLIPTLASSFFSLGGIFISEFRQDRRQYREVQFTQTAETKQTQIANAFDPSRPTSTSTPTLPPTITPAPTQGSQTLPPDQAIIEYYAALNRSEYLSAWTSLSDQFKARKLENDFSAYQSFWSTTGPVSIIELVPEGTPAPYTADVLVRLYWDSDRRTRTYKYRMIFDPLSQAWEIDQVLPVD